MSHSPDIRNGTLLVLTAAVIWGTTGTAQTFLPVSVSSLILGAVRLAIASLSLVAYVLLTGGFRLTSSWSWKFAIFAGVGIALSQLCFLYGVRKTGVAVGTIITIGSTPIFAAVLDRVLQKERLSRQWYLATLLSLGGILLLMLGGRVEMKANPTGILLTLVSGLFFSVSILSNKRLLVNHPPLMVIAVGLTIGALFTSPLLIIGDLSWLADLRGLLVALHLGLITNAVGHLIYGRGLRMISAHNAATLTLAEPLTAALLGILVVREKLSMVSITGLILIFGGLLILTIFSTPS